MADFTEGEGIDEPLATTGAGGTYYYHADGLGSITSLTDGSGVLAASYVYDSFGNPPASTVTITNPFRYTGRESDPESGLYYYRARYYDPAIGRFLSEDPSRFSSGIDFYPYAQQNPTSRIDPSGLQAPSPMPVPVPPPRPPFPPVRVPTPAPAPSPGGGASLTETIAGAAEFGVQEVIGAVVAIFTNFPTMYTGEQDHIDKINQECELKKKCKQQWADDVEWCSEAYADDPIMEQHCFNISDLNVERCLNGQARVNRDPRFYRKYIKKPE